MKVEVDICNKTDNCRIYSDVENWDICETTFDVYKVALKEYGRCVSKVYIDGENSKSKHIGWVFEKRVKYQDCNKTYIQETWIVPLSSFEIKKVREYALY